MGIRQFDCPECGAGMSVGVPRSSTITTLRARPDGSDGDETCRQTVCPNGHAVEFCFDR